MIGDAIIEIQSRNEQILISRAGGERIEIQKVQRVTIFKIPGSSDGQRERVAINLRFK